MLQEVALMRESVRHQGSNGEEQIHDSNVLLDEAEETIHQALALLGEDPKTHSVFMGELAAIRGTKLRHMVETSKPIEQILKQFDLTGDAVIHAWATDTENYIPIDILAWTTQAILGIEGLPEVERAKAAAQILYIFDMAGMENYGEYQAVQFQRRRQAIGQILGNVQLTENAFQALDNMNSGAGYYLRAQDIIGKVRLNTHLSAPDRIPVENALGYLEENLGRIRQDGSCLYLRFRLWWLLHVGQPWFDGERETLPFSIKDWQFCLQAISEMQALGTGLNANARMTYLAGLSAFHVEDFQQAFDIFRELERESDYRTGKSRIIKSYLASTQDGTPHVYGGEVRRVYRDDTKGWLYVPEIRREIPFFPREFNLPNVRPGDFIPSFHIAFNFLGLTADPLQFYTGRRA
jgi:hypothetical protein